MIEIFLSDRRSFVRLFVQEWFKRRFINVVLPGRAKNFEPLPIKKILSTVFRYNITELAG